MKIYVAEILNYDAIIMARDTIVIQTYEMTPECSFFSTKDNLKIRKNTWKKQSGPSGLKTACY